MIFKNYEYFIQIAKEGSITKAAEKLYIAESSLSKYLKRLETTLGVELFSRKSYPLKLTPAGELYMNYIKEVSRKSNKLEQDFSYIRNSNSGKVVLGITVWRSSILLPAVLPSFIKANPYIKIEIKEGSHQYMYSLLEENKVDFCIFHFPNVYNNITFEHLTFEHILFAVNKENPILKSIDYVESPTINNLNSEDFKKFKDEPFIMLKKGQNIRELTQNYLNKENIFINQILETSNIVTAMNLVSANMGVTFVPEAVLNSIDLISNLVFFKIDNPPLNWEVGIAYKTNKLLSKESIIFKEHIKEIYKK